jgi:predicted nucleic acid-binding protein
MKRILLDTNIIIDLLAKREPWYNEAASLFSLADKKSVELYTSALSFANTNFILSRQLKPDQAKLVLRKLKLMVHVLDLTDKILELSLNNDDFEDFEDAIQYFSALENEIEIIISRNLKDFSKSKLPVMIAEQFLRANLFLAKED